MNPPYLKKFTFAVFDDSGSGAPPQFTIAEQVKAATPDFIIHTGDVVYPAGEAENWDPRYFVPYQDLLDNICAFTTPGHHDFATDNGGPYQEALYLPHNNPLHTELYYSFNYGHAHFISLNGNQPQDEAQLDWLERDLRRVSGNPFILWKFVFLHFPPFSSGPHGVDPNDYGRLIAQNYMPLFERYGVDIVFAGHDHDYERTCPMLGGACAPPWP